MFQYPPRLRVFSLPLVASSWLLAIPALAQTAAAPAPPAPDNLEPALTVGTHPASAIAASRQSDYTKMVERGIRSLVLSQPDPDANNPAQLAPLPGTHAVIIPITARTSTAPKPAVPQASLSASLAPTSVMTAQRSSKVVYRPGVPTAVTAPTATTPTTVIPPATIISTTTRDTTARGNASRLPSRGGLIIGSAPVELSSTPPTAASTISPEQRVLLAKLDADLEKAQGRLDRAETHLTEDQKQLASFTDVLRSAMLEAGDDAPGLHPFVRVAQRYLGTPYVWGGESARGFDCSGFIMRVMRDLGYRALPHSAAEQFNYGTPIAKPLLKPGDIVFFANTYKPGISHVGIYLGRGRFIHAANSHVGTIVSNLNEPKWVEKYAGARRLISSGA